MIRLLLVALVLSASAAVADDGLTRLLRQPDIQGDRIAFVYGGDIWVVGSAGGTARRLTSHEGLELFPKFSPDGRWIAFSGEYSGTRQVHVISVDGGMPRQLTWYNDVGPLPPRGGFDNRIVDWTPDGKEIVFLAHRLPWGERMATFYTVPFEGGMEKALQIPEAGGGMLSPDGTRIVYTPIEREFRTWKRHRGGRAQDVWIYDLKNDTSEKITDFAGTDNQPMWVGDTIYFTSDRDFTLNLFAWDPATRQTRKVTGHDTWDVLWPSAGSDAIVYEAGGTIWKFDPGTEKSEIVPIRVFGDFPSTMPRFMNVKKNIETATISPTGVRALFGARGDVFTVPAKEGAVTNLTSTPGIRERDPAWSPDGKVVAYLSDRTGEYEVHVRNADGSGEERRITTGSSVWRFAPVWSPDSSRLAFADTNAELHIVEVATGKITTVDRGRFDDITTYRWSPDSRWIAYTKVGDTRMSSIWVYSLADGSRSQLTSGRTDDYDPVFDPNGRYLYFLSNRDFNLTFSGYEFNYLYTNPTRLYVAVLSADGPALFLPKNDTEKPLATAQPDSKKKDDAKNESAKKVEVKIDVAGFEERVRAIPGAPAGYGNLSAVPSGVLYTVESDGKHDLKLYDIDAKKEQLVLGGISSYRLSSDGQKVLYRQNGEFGIVDAKPAQSTTEAAISLASLEMKVDPRAEWSQQFVDAWRILRDWFYDPNMHGLDWAAMRAKYEVLVPHATHRTDLDYILGELGGELNAGHVYVQSNGGWLVSRKDNALLGAEIRPHASGYYQIVRIFPGENWHDDFRSPLTEPGVRVEEGDFIVAVDGRTTKGVANFYELLENKASRVVTLTVNAKPSTDGARNELVRPITSEGNLRYLDWVESRRAYVEKASGGRIGYIHIPNTATEGNRELFKHFYPQANKDALIIDDRYNGGGFIPDRMIELLDRPLLNYWVRRSVEPSLTPGFAHQGPKAVLINGYSSSGGDAFPYYFRKRGLGTIIGTRTWGGLIGLSGNASLMDGGSVLVPTFRFLDTEGMWAVENVGVAPDIEVVDRPELVAKGDDPSLEKAVEVLMAELKKNPPQKLVVPPPPDESK